MTTRTARILAQITMLAAILTGGGVASCSGKRGSLPKTLVQVTATPGGSAIAPQEVAGFYITGQAKDGAGVPVAGAKVSLSTFPGRVVTADGQGYFRIHVPESATPPLLIITGAQGETLLAVAVSDLKKPERGDTTNIGTVVMGVAAAISGNLTLSDGGSPEGVAVVVQGLPFGAMTNAQGRFQIISLPYGRWPVRAYKNGFEPLDLGDIVVDQGRQLELDPNQLTALTGPANASFLGPLCPLVANPTLRAEVFPLAPADFEATGYQMPNLEGKSAQFEVCPDKLDLEYTTAPHIFPSAPALNDWFVVRVRGKLRVETAGTHTLSLVSDDGGILTLDGRRIIENDGIHPSTQKDAAVALTAGEHDLEVLLSEVGGAISLVLKWTPPGGPSEIIPASAFRAAP